MNKTDMVVVDTEDVIKDRSEIFKDYRTAAWIEGLKDL